jgi:hypothetical protein
MPEHAPGSGALLPAMSTVADTRTLLELLTRRRDSMVRPVEIVHDAATGIGDTAPWCEHSLTRITRARRAR